jgi:hypothetical protein
MHFIIKSVTKNHRGNDYRTIIEQRDKGTEGRRNSLI